MLWRTLLPDCRQVDDRCDKAHLDLLIHGPRTAKKYQLLFPEFVIAERKIKLKLREPPVSEPGTYFPGPPKHSAPGVHPACRVNILLCLQSEM